MPKFNFGGLVDAVAYGTLDEILGMGRSKDGISKPSRYEVTLFPPTGSRGTGASGNSNIFTKIMGKCPVINMFFNLWVGRQYHSSSIVCGRNFSYGGSLFTLVYSRSNFDYNAKGKADFSLSTGKEKS